MGEGREGLEPGRGGGRGCRRRGRGGGGEEPGGAKRGGEAGLEHPLPSWTRRCVSGPGWEPQTREGQRLPEAWAGHWARTGFLQEG